MNNTIDSDRNVEDDSSPTLATALNTVKLFQNNISREQVSTTVERLFDNGDVTNEAICDWAIHQILWDMEVGSNIETDADGNPYAPSDEFIARIIDRRDRRVVEVSSAICRSWIAASKYYRIRYFLSGLFWGSMAAVWLLEVL